MQTSQSSVQVFDKECEQRASHVNEERFELSATRQQPDQEVFAPVHHPVPSVITQMSPGYR